MNGQLGTIPRGECSRCRMGFRIQRPPQEFYSAEYTRCHDCKRRFWHASGRYDRTGGVVVGVDPADYGAGHD